MSLLNEQEKQYFQLLPFLHQISGHNLLLKYDEKTICKLLNKHEQEFYETSSIDLYEFLPKYKGTIKVKIDEDECGYKKFLVDISSQKQQQLLQDVNNNDNDNQHLVVEPPPNSTVKQLWNKIKSSKDTILS